METPSFFLESEQMYGLKGEVPEEEYLIPIGEGKIKREGSDVTLVAHGKMLHVARQAADQLAKDGIECEIIDPRTIKPFDINLVVESVKKTNRVVLLDESHPFGGVAAEVGFLIQREAFDYLDAPVQRVTLPDVPAPFAPEPVRYLVPGRQTGYCCSEGSYLHPLIIFSNSIRFAMAIIIDMPKLSDTMEEGVISKWNIKEGDAVKSGDIIAEVETDKATMDVEAFDDGVVLKILAKEGEAVPLGGKMVILGEKGEDISGLLDGEEGGSAPKDSKEKSAAETAEKTESKENKADFDPLFGEIESKKESKDEAAPSEEDGRLKASPLARKIAEEQGIQLSQVKGSGPNGRIVKKDVEHFEPVAASAAPASKAAPSAPVYEITAEDQEFKISQMRKTIAKRLAESKFTNPHFYETIDIDMKRAIEARTAMNAGGDVKISFNDLVVKACAKALRLHPKMNSSWLGDVIRQHGGGTCCSCRSPLMTDW